MSRSTPSTAPPNLSLHWRETLSGLPVGSSISVSGPHSHGYGASILTPTHHQHDPCRDGEPCLRDVWRAWEGRTPEEAMDRALSTFIERQELDEQSAAARRAAANAALDPFTESGPR